MGTVIVLYLVFLITMTVNIYAYDDVELWDDDLKKPSLEDIEEKEGRYLRDLKEYSARFIFPAHLYYYLNEDMKKLQSKKHTMAIAFNLMLSGIIGLAMTRLNEFPDSPYICILISLVICALSALIIHLVYKKTKLKLPKYEEFYFRGAAEYRACDISEETRDNNNTILMRLAYIESVKKSVILRYSLNQVMCALGAFAMYLLTYFCTE